MSNPTAEYTSRLAARRSRRDETFRRMQLVSWIRLGVGFLTLLMLWLAYTFLASLSTGLKPWLIIIPGLAFVALVIYHERLKRRHQIATRAVTFYEQGLERIQGLWQGKGNPGTTYVSDAHLYANDLDLFGPGSLFELLCTASTRSGEDTLAAWLKEPADRTEILARQEAIRELRDQIDLREDLFVIGAKVRSEVDPEFISAWAGDPPKVGPPWMRAVAAALVASTLLILVYGAFGGSFLPLRYTLALEVMLGLFFQGRVREVIKSVGEPARELGVLGRALQRIERETFSSSRLRHLQSRMQDEGKKASREIAALLKLVGRLDERRNEFFFLPSLALLWATQFTFAIEAWRSRCGPSVPAWLKNFGEFEAICALAGYMYEHPEDPFPEIVEGSVVFEGDELRHPLLPESSCVPNSVQLGGERHLMLVSGSNMSGKSTLLRIVGINVVLAQAGAPVRAKRVRLCPVSIGATLRVQDSLQAGVSRFYAEIQRLHDTMELTSGARPVLFLLDEILHGTNSHDRAIGAEAVVRGLVDRGAIGLVTTHDLALARVAESMAPRAVNVHFEDHLENGRMVFDYVLRPGVVQKSNALELMRAVGLKV